MNYKVNREIHKVKNKSMSRINPELSEQLKFWGIDSRVIDSELYKKDIEVIKVYFERSKTWLVMKAAASASSLALLINTWDNIFLRILFIISFLFGTIGAMFANRKYNIMFNTLLKKIEKSTK